MSFDNREWKDPSKIELGRYYDDLPLNQPIEIVVFIYNHKLLTYDLYQYDVSAFHVRD
jgi:hypothetical protein